jgi:hypothetical protein
MRVLRKRRRGSTGRPGRDRHLSQSLKEEIHMVATPKQRHANLGMIISGVIVILGILTMLLGSFLVGLVATLIGFTAVAVFAFTGVTERRETS